MIKRCWFVLFVWVFVGLAGAHASNQTRQIDSLRQLLKAASDTERVHTYLELFKTTYQSDYEQAQHYGERALLLADSMGYQRMATGARMNLGTLNTLKGKYTLAAQYYEDALQTFLEDDDQIAVGMCLGNLGTLYQELSQWRKSEQYLQQAMAISIELNDSIGIGILSTGLGSVYQRLGKPDSSISYFEQSLQYFLDLDMPGEQATSLANMGKAFRGYKRFEEAERCMKDALSIHQQLGSKRSIALDHQYLGALRGDQRRWQESLDYYNIALQLYHELGSNLGEAKTLLGIAQIHSKSGNPQEALRINKQALSMLKEHPNKDARCSALIGTGIDFTALEQPDSASSYLLEAIALALEANIPKMEREAIKHLIPLYRKQGHSNKIKQYQKRFNQLNDSLVKTEDLSSFEKLQAIYHANRAQLLEEKALAQRQQLELEQNRNSRQKLVILMLSLVLVLLAVVFVLVRLRRKSIIRKKKLKEREDGLRAMINADHQIREKVSRDLHDGLGQLLTGLKLRMHGLEQLTPENDPSIKHELTNMNQLVGNALEEVRTMSYLMLPPLLSERGLVPALESMLSLGIDPAQISYEFHHSGMEERLPEQVEINLYRICQELVANTLKHAKASSINIQLLRSKEQILLSVEDDGDGFDPQLAISKGAGLRNIKNRVEMMQGKLVVEQTLPHGQITKIRIQCAA